MSLTAFFILIFSLIFCNIFLIPITFLTDFPDWLLYPFFWVIMYIITILVFSDDVLYYGCPNNKYVKAFQSNWPSKHIAEKFSISQKDASYYWLENFFNKWANPKHPRNVQYKRTLQRGYECRFIYYCIKFLNILVIFSISIVILTEIVFPRIPFFADIRYDVQVNSAIPFILLIVFVNILLRIGNKTKPDKLTGVWKRFEEINKMHIKWIDDNITSFDKLKRA